METRNAKGMRLCDLIHAFSEYDLRKDPHGGIRIVVIGCAKKPGIYYLPGDTTISTLRKIVHPVNKEEHPSYAARTFRIFRRQSRSISVDSLSRNTRNFPLLDGDVIEIPVFVF